MIQIHDYTDTVFTIDNLAEFLREKQYEFPVPLGTRTSLRDYAEKLISKGKIYVAHANNAIVGLIAGYCNDTVTKSGYISIIVLDLEFRGQGISNRLLSRFIAACTASGMNVINVLTHQSNVEAIGLYSKFGFIKGKLSETKEYSFKKTLISEV
jgi:ribosomal protein S18 acetylase RimI-like enzyme